MGGKGRDGVRGKKGSSLFASLRERKEPSQNSIFVEFLFSCYFHDRRESFPRYFTLGNLSVTFVLDNSDSLSAGAENPTFGLQF